MPIYKKFSPEQANNLREILDASNFYPSKKKIKEIAKSMRMPILKIENWFKYNRRKMHFKGEFGEYKLRKSFKKSELTHLKSLYETNSSPSFIECAQISKELSGITPEQVKNWFANQRRKIKTISTQSVDLKIENRVSKAKEKEPEANENENVESMASLKIDHSKERKNLEDFIKFEKEPTQVPDQKLKIDLQTNNQLLFDEYIFFIIFLN